MFTSQRNLILLMIVAILTLAACAAPVTPAPTAAPPTSAPATAAAPAVTAAPAATSTPLADQPVPGGTFVVTYATDLASLDPPTALSTMDWGSVALVLYNGLYVFDTTNTLVPDIADGMPQVSSDGTVYTIKLKKGVQFHNGRELKAADIKYSIERNAMPETKSWAATDPMSSVVGGKDVLDGKAKEASGIKVVDDYTIQFTLTAASPYFPYSLTQTTNFIVPREEVEKWGKDYPFHPVGTGPFKMTEWIPKQKVTFVRNATYFKKGLPYLDKIEYQLGAAASVSLLRYQKGEVDELVDGIPSADIPSMSTDPQWSKYFINGSSFLLYFIGFNLQNPPFNKLQVRQAVGMAINRTKVIQLSSGTGVATFSLYHPSFLCNSKGAKDPFPYDPAAARKLLADAGYPDGFSTKGWLRESRAWISRVPESIQQDLAAIGIKAELQQMENAVGNKAMDDGTLPMFATTWGATYPDPYSMVNPVFQSAAVTAKRLRYSNPSVDQLITKASTTVDVAARCKVWQDAEQAILADAPVIPIAFLGRPLMQSARLKGVLFNPTYGRPVYEQVWITKDKQ
jgi:peptide/nickel transport system substrate-binding protein